MRVVSWIVVVGAFAWLLYAQLSLYLEPEALEDIPDERVRGTMAPEDEPLDAAGQGEGQGQEQGPDQGPDQDQDDGGSGGARDVIAYAQIYPMLEATAAVERLDRIEALAMVRSRDPDVAPGDIVLTLDDGEQVHHFPVSDDGQVRLPARPEWRDAAYPLRSNQPAGTLDLYVTFIMRALPGPEVEYAWLWESTQQMGQAMAAMQEARAAPPGDVVGVIFEFAPGVNGEVRAGEGPDGAVLQADEQGVLRMELSSEILEENPILAFRPMPERMVPLLVPPEETASPDAPGDAHNDAHNDSHTGSNTGAGSG